MCPRPSFFFLFFFNDTATTEIYTLSLHDALPISSRGRRGRTRRPPAGGPAARRDRKSTRLNSSHQKISYAVFCLKKKKRQYSVYKQSKGKQKHKQTLIFTPTD